MVRNKAVALAGLLRRMDPVLNPGRYAFVSIPHGVALDPDLVVALIRESQGLSVIVPEEVAREMRLAVAFSAAWITLAVHSDLAAVGFTAAFSRALGDAGISCNVVAGVQHDHLFVPVEQAQSAMAVLEALARSNA